MAVEVYFSVNRGVQSGSFDSILNARSLGEPQGVSYGPRRADEERNANHGGEVRQVEHELVSAHAPHRDEIGDALRRRDEADEIAGRCSGDETEHDWRPTVDGG